MAKRLRRIKYTPRPPGSPRRMRINPETRQLLLVGGAGVLGLILYQRYRAAQAVQLLDTGATVKTDFTGSLLAGATHFLDVRQQQAQENPRYVRDFATGGCLDTTTRKQVALKLCGIGPAAPAEPGLVDKILGFFAPVKATAPAPTAGYTGSLRGKRSGLGSLG